MEKNSQAKIYQFYLSLLKEYGAPREFWARWCKEEKTRQDREEVVLGAILTQRTNWRNVEIALKNLKEANSLSIKGVYQLASKNARRLEELIRPSGFYKQKAKRLFEVCRFIVESHKTVDRFFKQDAVSCREQLLGINGIGPETADSILLYAGNKPVFVMDEYTRRLAKKHKLSHKLSYNELQQLFMKSLPQDVKIYRDFHAMLVLEGKGTDWDLVSKI